MTAVPFVALVGLLAAGPLLAAERPTGPNAEVVREAEETLRDEGYLAQADGTFDDDTRRALSRFQEERALHVTGELDELTKLSLGLSSEALATAPESERQEQVGQPPREPQLGATPSE